MAHVTFVHYTIGTVPHLNHSNLFYIFADNNSSTRGAGNSCSVCTLRFRVRAYLNHSNLFLR